MTKELQGLYHETGPQDILKALSMYNRAYATMATELGCIKTAEKIISLLSRGTDGPFRVLYVSETSPSIQYAQSVLAESLEEQGISVNSFDETPILSRDSMHSVYFVSSTDFQRNENWIATFNIIGFDLVIVDRAHLVASEQYAQPIQEMSKQGVKLFGVSTVPTDEEKENKTLLSLFGKEVVSISLEDGITLGWLSHFTYRVMDANLKDNFSEILSSELKKGKLPSLQSLNKTLFIESLDEQIVNQILEHTPDQGKALIFCKSIAQANIYLALFAKIGPLCRGFHSEYSDATLRRNLNDFIHGNVRFLLVVDMADQLRDLPQLDSVFLLRNTKSRTVFYDQLRVSLSINPKLRKPNHSVQLFDYVGSLDELMRTRTALEKAARTRADKKEAEAVIQKQQTGRVLQSGVIPDFPKDDSGVSSQGAILEGVPEQPVQVDVLDQQSSASPKKRKKNSSKIIHISAEGFDYEFSEELLRLAVVAEKIQLGYYPLKEEATAASKALGITSSEEYVERYLEDVRLPKNPKFYKDFINWDEYLDTPVGFFFRLSEEGQIERIKEEFKKKGISNHNDLVRLSNKLETETFGVFEGYLSFIKIILGKEKLKTVNALSLVEVSQKLSWKEPATVL